MISHQLKPAGLKRRAGVFTASLLNSPSRDRQNVTGDGVVALDQELPFVRVEYVGVVGDLYLDPLGEVAQFIALIITFGDRHGDAAEGKLWGTRQFDAVDE